MNGGGRGHDGWAGVVPDLSTDDVPAAGEPSGFEAEATDPELPMGPWLPSDAPTESGPEPAEPSSASMEAQLAARPDEVPTEVELSAASPLSETTLLDSLRPSDRVGPPLGFEPPTSFWREYRELIVTSVIGVSALAAALVWGRSGLWGDEATEGANRARRTVEPRRPPARAAPVNRPPAAPPPKSPDRSARSQPPAAATPPTPPDGEKEGRRERAATTPMLTIVTVPSGAMVEIDGVVYGRTPLIMPAPPDRREFDVELRLDEHQPWSGVLRQDASGHFSINRVLEPFGRSSRAD